jgi:hypothetical protein
MNNLRFSHPGLILLCMLFAILSGHAQEPLPRTSRLPGQRFSNQPEIKIQVTPALKMRVVEEKVFADISASPLQTVLQELADRTGIQFEIRSQDNPSVSVHLDGIPLIEAIERIVSNSNKIYIYDKNDSARISLVRILPRSNPLQQPSILLLGTGVVTKVNVEIQTPEQAQKVLSSTADLDDRKKAVEFLVNAKGKSSVQALMEMLNDSAPEIRISAINGLVLLKANNALSGILPALKDRDPGVRQSAVSAVALLGTSRNIKDLKPLTYDKNYKISAAAESAIQRLTAVKQ